MTKGRRVTIHIWSGALHDGATGIVVEAAAGREWYNVRLDGMKRGTFIRFPAQEVLPEAQAVREALCA